MLMNIDNLVHEHNMNIRGDALYIKADYEE